VLLSSWRAIFHATSAEEVEALALEGVRLAAEWERKKVILESDCEAVINLLNSTVYNRSALCPRSRDS
jgi:hypothetical protein